MDFFEWVGTLPDLAQLVAWCVTVGVMAAVIMGVLRVVYIGPARWFGRVRRLEGDVAALQAELERLRLDAQASSGESPRMHELEERMDFAERVLARPGAREPLPARRDAGSS